MQVLRRCAVVAIAAFAGYAAAQTGTYKDLIDFTQASGYGPRSGVVLDSVGNMYVALQTQNQGYAGLIAKFAPNGVETVLHDFNHTITYSNGTTGSDGSTPQGVTLDASGNVFGVTANGGLYHSGILFEITSAGHYIDLHDFGGTVKNANGVSGPDGQTPVGNVAIDRYGNLFGVAENGGANASAVEKGMVWELTSGGIYKDLHDFGGTITNASGSSGPDGGMPETGPSFDAVGNLYGVTPAGGVTGSPFSIGAGNVWEITVGGVYKDLHDFGRTVTLSDGSIGTDGYSPYCVPSFDAAGNIYGTTSAGGPGSGGVLWELSNSRAYKDLHDFRSQLVPYTDGSAGPDGTYPGSGVVVDTAGNIFGTTTRGGYNYAIHGGTMQQQGWIDYGGVAYEYSTAGAYQVLHAYGGTLTNSNGTYADGQFPIDLALDAAGNLLIAAFTGGPTGTPQNTPPGGGMISQIYYTALAGVSVSPTTVLAGTTAIGTITLSAPAPVSGSVVTLWTSNTSASVPLDVTIPAGQTTGEFPISTFGVVSPTNITVTATMVGITYTALITVNPAQALKLSLSPTSVAGGTSSTGTVTLPSRAGLYGVVVALSSSSTSASVPASLFIPAGGQTGLFIISTSRVNVSTLTTINAKLGATTATAVLAVTPPSISAVTISPTSVPEGSTTTGTVTLSGTAPSGGSLVSLTSNNSCAGVPPTLYVPFGASTASFTITTSVVSNNTTATIAATLNGTRTATLTVLAASVSGITVGSSGQAFGPGSTTGTVLLNGPTGSAGASISLASDNSVASVPSTVFVPAGQTTATFAITLGSSSQVQVANITATQGSNLATAQLKVLPSILSGLTISPHSLIGGQSSVGTISLRNAASGNTFVKVVSNNSNVTVPAMVSIPNGSASAQFPITTTANTNRITVAISASQGSTQYSATLTVGPLSVASLSLSPNSVAGGSSSTATITLTTAAPSYGAVVALSSNSSSATVPSNVFVSGGSTTATFTVNTKPVSAVTSATISASLGGSTQTAGLSINPPGLTLVGVSPSNVVGGRFVTGIVILSSPAPASGEIVNLFSYSPNAKVSSSVFVASGATLAYFSVVTYSVSSNTDVNIYAALGGIEKSTTLTLTPPRLLTLQFAPSTVKGGESSTGTLTLSDPVGPYGALIDLSSSDSCASVPPYLYLAPGAISCKFTITTTPVGPALHSIIKATLASSAISATLTVTNR